MFLNELERILTERLGVAWGPERNGCREMVGFTREQLRAFSKRTVAIETHLEADGELAFPTRSASGCGPTTGRRWHPRNARTRR